VKKIVLMLALFAMLIPCATFGETTLTSPEVRADIDRYRFSRLRIVTYPELWIEIELHFGYDNAGTFEYVTTRTASISNRDIAFNGENVARDDENGMMLELPPAYQENPATKIAQELFYTGNYGGSANGNLYLEQIIKTIAGL